MEALLTSAPSVKCLVVQTGVIVAVIVLASTSSSAAGLRRGCLWDQYYDENVDGCGPCREICDLMSLTSTERQCQEQCSAYLVHKSCTPDQYFEESRTVCLPCAALCSEEEKNGASQKCHEKCPAFLEKQQQEKQQQQRQPAMSAGGKHVLNTTRGQPSSPSSLWGPGVVAFVVTGVLSATAIGGFVVHRRYRGARRRTRTRTGTGTGTGPLEDTPGDRVPVQVSGEDINDISLQGGNAGAEEAHQYHMAETDPRAPSSSAAEMVQLMLMPSAQLF